MESSTNQNRDEKYILAKPTQLGDLFIPIQLNKSVQVRPRTFYKLIG